MRFLGVLRGVNVAYLTMKLPKFWASGGGAGETRVKSRGQGRSSLPRPLPAPPKCQDGHPHPHSTFAKKWEQQFLTFTVDKYQLRRQSQNAPSLVAPQ